jgi:hypothetical protein
VPRAAAVALPRDAFSATNVVVIGAWVTFPLLFVALSLGCGLLIDRLSGGSIPGTLLAPVGLAAIVVEAQLFALDGATAELAVPFTVMFALAGFACSRGRLRGPDWAAAGTAAGVFAVFAAPVVMSGEATFAGYIKLDDTATWLAITDHVIHHGRDVGGLAPSTYETTLAVNITGGYPIGAFLPLGIGAGLLPTDAAWLFQPYECVLAAMLALALYELTGRLIERRALRAVVAFFGAQPTLLLGYSLWGGVKEVAAAALIALVVALLPWRLDELRMSRMAGPALAAAALMGVLSFGGAVWVALPLLACATVLARAALAHRAALADLARAASAFVVLGAVFALPSLLTANVFVRGAASGSGFATNEEDLGNLIEPLDPLQVAGVWPAGDFRVDPESLGVTNVLIVLVFGMAAAGVAIAIARRRWGLAVFSACTLASGLALVAFASPWVEAKGLATASPAVLVAALAACAVALEGRARAIGALAGGAIVAGVVWSNALAYHDVSLAPRDRLAELETIGERIDGDGPALMTEYEPYGVRHFLRDGDPEGASELRRRYVYLRDGKYLDKGQAADIDAFRLDQVMVYRALVLRRSPTASRPPSVYRRTWSGRYYELWQRPPGTDGAIAEHLPLGTPASPSSTPDCRAVERLAASAGPGARLLASVRPDPTLVSVPANEDDFELSVRSGSGEQELWLGGSVRRTLDVSVDGKRVAHVRHELNPTGGYIPLGRLSLEAGSHRVRVEIHDSALRPGGGGPQPAIGPLALRPATPDGPLIELPARAARKLCGRSLDWIEAVS